MRRPVPKSALKAVTHVILHRYPLGSISGWDILVGEQKKTQKEADLDGHDRGACGAAGQRLGDVQRWSKKGLGDQRAADWPVTQYSAADHHLRGEREFSL